MTSEQRACQVKVRHATQFAACRAKSAMLALTHEERSKLQVYSCRFCHGWHVGHLKINPAPLRPIARMK